LTMDKDEKSSTSVVTNIFFGYDCWPNLIFLYHSKKISRIFQAEFWPKIPLEKNSECYEQYPPNLNFLSVSRTDAFFNCFCAKVIFYVYNPYIKFLNQKRKVKEPKNRFGT
jgi:hypothetical protein